ncbi:MAG: glycoside hydrolase family 3 C-terminal domain-containing protein [Pyrinomonadaceae bacterium]
MKVVNDVVIRIWLEMPSGVHMNKETLLPALKDGKVSQATIDEKIRRILRTAVRFGWFDREQADLSIPRFNPEGLRVALESARASMVLLKNERNLLPLDKTRTRSIAIIGPGAFPAVPVGGGSARVEPFRAISFMEGLSNAVGPETRIYYHRGIPSLGEMAQGTNFTTAVTEGQPGLRSEYFSSGDLITSCLDRSAELRHATITHSLGRVLVPAGGSHWRSVAVTDAYSQSYYSSAIRLAVQTSRERKAVSGHRSRMCAH